MTTPDPSAATPDPDTIPSPLSLRSACGKEESPREGETVVSVIEDPGTVPAERRDCAGVRDGDGGFSDDPKDDVVAPIGGETVAGGSISERVLSPAKRHMNNARWTPFFRRFPLHLFLQ